MPRERSAVQKLAERTAWAFRFKAQPGHKCQETLLLYSGVLDVQETENPALFTLVSGPIYFGLFTSI